MISTSGPDFRYAIVPPFFTSLSERDNADRHRHVIDEDGTAMSNTSLYESDFHAWVNEQAALLRVGALSSADIEHIALEIESIGGRKKRELISRLAVLLMHLLKWEAQPTLRDKSWRATIKVQRRELARHLGDNPSLKANLDEAIADAYGDAILNASRETGLDEESFPASCPWSLDQIARDDFWPERR